MSNPRPHPLPRLEGSDRIYLATRQAVAAMTNRNPSQVSANCQPIACDVRTRLPLYDALAADETLQGVQRRRRVA